MQAILDLIKKLLPKSVLKKIRPIGHGFLAYMAAWYYGFPSRKLVVVGVTGTAGKSTTIKMLAAILNASGSRTGFITTVDSNDGKSDIVNTAGLTMPGRFALQHLIKTMVQNGCKYCVVEASSEGLAQNRHLGIDFDVALLTNLDQAHLDSHGSFEAYKHAKMKLFAALRAKKKDFFLEKILGVGLNQSEDKLKDLKEFVKFPTEKKFTSSFGAGEPVETGVIVFSGEALDISDEGSTFVLNNVRFTVRLPGRFNAENGLLAVACANTLGVDLHKCAVALSSFSHIDGRMESVPNYRGIQIFLDYAPEPLAMKRALEALAGIEHKKIIHVFGSTGGHRDVSKRFEFGSISAHAADVIIITNDDVYDSDPEKIAADITDGINRETDTPKKVKSILKILDRQSAIRKAFELAEPGDIVLITGKGSEKFLVLPGNQRIEWDERKIIDDILAEL